MFFPSRQFSFTFVISVDCEYFSPKVVSTSISFSRLFHLGKRATLERTARKTAKVAGKSTKSESSWIVLFHHALASSILEPKRGRVPRNAKNVGGTQRARSFSEVPDPWKAAIKRFVSAARCVPRDLLFPTFFLSSFYSLSLSLFSLSSFIHV